MHDDLLKDIWLNDLDVGAQCKDCRLVRVCRVPKARAKAMDTGGREKPVEGDGTVLLDRMWDQAQMDSVDRKFRDPHQK